MSKKKKNTDIEQLRGILEQFSKEDIEKAVELLGEPEEAETPRVTKMSDLPVSKLFEKAEKIYVKEQAEEAMNIWEEFYAPEMAPEEVEAEAARIAEIDEVRERNEEAIIDLPNVVGVATGYIITKGKPTKELGLSVFVEKKMDVEPHELVGGPKKEIEGIRTDVVETGRIDALAYKARIRPARPGFSIGHFRITAGTFGCMVQDKKTHEFKILSNNHVLANVNVAKPGDSILQPGRYDGGMHPRDTIATLESFVPLVSSPYNLVDAAVAKPNDLRLVIPSIVRIGIPTGTPCHSGAQARPRMRVVKSGRTTQTTTGVVINNNATVRVHYGAGRYLLFKNQIVTTAMSAGGDSGSLLLDLATRRAVGLLFAGSKRITIHNNIANVLMALGITLVEAM